MPGIKKKWVAWEELEAILAGATWTPSTTVDASQVGGLTPGSIPFADADGFLTEDNPDLFWDAAEANLGIGTNVFGADMQGGIQIALGVPPTGNVEDTFAFYAADFAAGNACPYFRTEDGTVIGLNQSLLTTDSPIFDDLTITTPSNIYGLSHDSFADYAADEHYPVLDEDNMVSDSDAHVATQQSIKAYVDAAGNGNGAAGPVLIFDSGFDDLALGNIDGKGSYSLWGTWVNTSGAGCTAEIVADPGNGRMLRLNDQSAVNASAATLTMTPSLSAEVLMGIVEWKVKISVLAATSRGYIFIRDKDDSVTGQGGYFRGDSDDIWYRSSGGSTAHLVNAVVDTWYIVRTFFDRLGDYSVWWVDGAFEQSRIVMNAGNKFDMLTFATRDIHSGCVFDIKYVKVWSLNYVQ